MSKNVIIDNGAYEIKYGEASDDKPKHIPNCVVRTNTGRVLLGENLRPEKKVITDYSGIHYRRPIEHSQLTQWSLEKQIWDNTFMESHFTDNWLEDSNLIYCESPFTISKFQNMSDEILFEEYGIANLYRCSSGFLTPWLNNNKQKNEKSQRNYNDFQFVIDSGFDSTWVIPMIYGLPYWKAVRKMPIAGKFLNGYMREMISFRHYNVTDEMVVVNNIKEKACYVSPNYEVSLGKVEKSRNGVLDKKKMEEISINYVLPDFKTSTVGYTLTNSELATLERKEEIQSLKLYDERFAIPELLFHPELSGAYKAGLITTIKDSLNHVPELLRPLMVANMILVGGTSNLPGYENRLVSDLKQEVPIDNKIIVRDLSNFTEDHSEIGWFSGRQFFKSGAFNKVCVSKHDYQELGVEYTQEKFGYKL